MTTTTAVNATQVKALRLIHDNPGRVIAAQRTADVKDYLKINGNTEGSLITKGLVRKVSIGTGTHRSGGQSYTYDKCVWELTDLGRTALGLDEEPAETPAPAAQTVTPAPEMTPAEALTAARTVTPEELTTMSEPHIDTLNAALSGDYARLEQQRNRAWENLYNAMGAEKKSVPSGRGWRQEWALRRDEAEEQARALLAGDLAIDPRLIRYEPMLTTEAGRAGYLNGIRRVVEDLDRIGEETRALNEGPARVLAGEWQRRGGWSRFFLCTNADGHIHKDRSCASLRLTTSLAWLPALSGLTEKDAVAAHGPVLCTLCFPSAPVEWTVGRPEEDDGRCKGTGRYVRPENPRRSYQRAECPECGERVTLTSTWKVRKHPGPAPQEPETTAPEAAQEAAPAAEAPERGRPEQNRAGERESEPRTGPYAGMPGTLWRYLIESDCMVNDSPRDAAARAALVGAEIRRYRNGGSRALVYASPAVLMDIADYLDSLAGLLGDVMIPASEVGASACRVVRVADEFEKAAKGAGRG